MEGEEALNEETRQELHDELEALEAELMRGQEADDGRVVELLRRVGEIDLDFLELVLSGLRHTQGEAQSVVERAIESVTESRG